MIAKHYREFLVKSIKINEDALKHDDLNDNCRKYAEMMVKRGNEGIRRLDEGQSVESVYAFMMKGE